MYSLLISIMSKKMSEARKYIFRAANVWWRYVQYFVIPPLAKYIDTIDVCIAHVCFYVCCSDCVGVCGNGCCVADIVEDAGVFEQGKK